MRRWRQALHTVVQDGSTRDNSYKIKSRLLLDIRKSFFSIRVIREWNMLPRKTVSSPSLEVLKTKLAKVPSHLL